MSNEPNPYQEGKRAGIHPLIVVFAVLIGLWLFVFLIVPSSKNKQATGTEGPTGPIIEDPEAAPVLFKVRAVVADRVIGTGPINVLPHQLAAVFRHRRQVTQPLRDCNGWEADLRCVALEYPNQQKRDGAQDSKQP